MATGLGTFKRFHGEQFGRDPIMCNAAISACENSCQRQQALELFERLEREQMEQGTMTYTYRAAISACEIDFQWQQAMELFVRMEGEQVEALSFTVLPSVLARKAANGSRLKSSS